VNADDQKEPRQRPGLDLDLRSLRYFVAAAEELHFTRAAARLFVAQQALSRDIQRLERQLGVSLFLRTTRRVTLTAEGERLLVRARELLAIHDLALDEVHDPVRPIMVDLLSAGRLTGVRILDVARMDEPSREFRARYSGGFGAALASLLSGDLDVALGRVDGIGRDLAHELESHVIRLEPLALMLPEDHSLAAHDPVPIPALAGLEVDAGLGNPAAPEWMDLMRQLLDMAGARATAPHPVSEGPDEQAHHLTSQGIPIVTGLDHQPISGGVIRMLSDPIALYPWSIVYRRDAHLPGIRAVRAATQRLEREEAWLSVPDDAWLPEPERSRRSLERR